MSNNNYPNYGIKPGTARYIKSTNNYDIWADNCNDLEKCIRNDHYSIPNKQCKNGEIILPHHTVHKYNTNTVSRTFYFPERIDSATHNCRDMSSYVNKITNPKKICNSQTNTCVLTQDREIPDVYLSINEIIKQLDNIVRLLRYYCNGQRNVKTNIEMVMNKYTQARQYKLFTNADALLDPYQPLSTQYVTNHMSRVNLSMVLAVTEFSDTQHDEFKEYVRAFLLNTYTFLSTFIELLINQPVNVSDKLSHVNKIIDSCSQLQPMFTSDKQGDVSGFKALSTSDDLEDASVDSPKESPAQSISLLKTKPVKPLVKEASEQYPQESMKLQIQQMQKEKEAKFKRICDLDIGFDAILEFIENENPPIPIRGLTAIRNDAIQLITDKGFKKPKQCADILKHTILSIDIIEIYYGIHTPGKLLSDRLVNLTPEQYNFLDNLEEPYYQLFHDKFITIIYREKFPEITSKLENIKRIPNEYVEILAQIVSKTEYSNKMMHNILNTLMEEYYVYAIKTCLMLIDISRNHTNSMEELDKLVEKRNRLIQKIYPICYNIYAKYSNLHMNPPINPTVQINEYYQLLASFNSDASLFYAQFNLYSYFDIPFDLTSKEILSRLKQIKDSLSASGKTPEEQITIKNKILEAIKLIGQDVKREEYLTKLNIHYRCVYYLISIMIDYIFDTINNIIFEKSFKIEVSRLNMIKNVLFFAKIYCIKVCDYKLFIDRIQLLADISDRLYQQQIRDAPITRETFVMLSSILHDLQHTAIFEFQPFESNRIINTFPTHTKEYIDNIIVNLKYSNRIYLMDSPMDESLDAPMGTP